MKRWSILALFVVCLVIGVWLAIRSTLFYPEGSIAFYGGISRYDKGIYLFSRSFFGVPRLTRITPPELVVGDYCWSPDGARLAFQCRRLDEPWGICLMDRDGRNLSLLLSAEQTDFLIAWPLAWSPDGGYILFRGSIPASRSVQKLYRVDPDTGDFRELSVSDPPGTALDAWSMSFSPDGDRVLLQLGFYEVYRLDLQTRQLTYLTQGDHPVWSPSGETIAMAGGGPLRAMSPDGTNQQTLYSGDDACVGTDGLAWSADGEHILFLAGCSENEWPTPYLYEVQTGKVRRLMRVKRGGIVLDQPTWVSDADR